MSNEQNLLKTDIIFKYGKGHFRPYETFLPKDGYKLLPFRLNPFSSGRYIITNEGGEYLIISASDLQGLVDGVLSPQSKIYEKLAVKHFILDETNVVALDLLSLKARTKRNLVAEFTSLHMFVVTLRCNQSCHYCQVSRQSEDKAAFDLSEEHTEKALDHTFRSPSRNIKIEFQGGESLLNFRAIQQIVEGAKKRNAAAGKRIEFVAATNLTYLTEEILTYFKKERIYISTSLDGPKDLHNKNRPYRERDAYEIVRHNIAWARSILGPDSVSALMTTTKRSLACPKEIIDEYIEAGFREIFLRPLSPYGFALKTKAFHDYDTAEWLSFFKTCLDYILLLNKNGIFFREIYSTILLRKILSPFGTGFVNLQSPAGVAIAGIIYNYDGAIYGSDEGRMLAAMGDDCMKLGHIDDRYEDIFLSETLYNMLSESLPESSPMCHRCAFLPYCGADPDYHYARQRDFKGHKALSGFCQKNMAILQLLIEKLEANDAEAEILRSWAC